MILHISSVRNGKCTLKLYQHCKYNDAGDPKEVLELDGVSGFAVLTGDAGKEIGAEMVRGGMSEDPYNEYLRIFFENGEEATYRNSFVDLFGE